MSAPSAASSFRYGVFLRPDPGTCALLTDLHLLLRQQYGLVSCAAYPPHATLVGNMPTDAPEDELTDRIGTALAGTVSFTAYNVGIEKGGGGIGFNLHGLPDGSPNPGITALLDTVRRAVAPVARPMDHYRANPLDPGRFRAHLSIASHELLLRPELRPEILDFVEGLGWEPPRSFTADTVSLFRFRSPDWHAQWWLHMTWDHVRSWRLEPGAAVTLDAA
ncbi:MULTISPECIES: 2'-5' RNA ligase family protein [unclassified Streptomyces]|uniref:2'-5' RNA ligase family protein n=1 Tax=unclassified Streptomyces TaxID=2593676 RepID=UPI00168B83A4|nr:MULTISPECIES: 2'-5' RNA ligase family protein [unclassified Streptomyces]MBD3010677.1 heme utilization protein [Streptomyces sp. 5-10]